MEDLNLLVQLAGGEQRTVRRLKEAGFKSPADIATGDPEQLRETSELSAAAVRRLIKAAGEHMAGTPDGEGDLAMLRRKEPTAARKGASASPRRRKGKKRPHRSGDATPAAAAVVGPADTDRPAVSPLVAVASRPEAAPAPSTAPAASAANGPAAAPAANAVPEPGQGVSLTESAALTGGAPEEGWRHGSFWRFG